MENKEEAERVVRKRMETCLDEGVCRRSTGFGEGVDRRSAGVGEGVDRRSTGVSLKNQEAEKAGKGSNKRKRLLGEEQGGSRRKVTAGRKHQQFVGKKVG